MAQAYMNIKESTPCGGRVRYDVNSDDMISYSSFTNTAPCRKCPDCSWRLLCVDGMKYTDALNKNLVPEVLL